MRTDLCRITLYKSGGSGSDQFQVGTWTDGKPGSAAAGGTPGTWAVLAGTGTVFQDKGKTHASKDFHDPVRFQWKNPKS